MARYRGLAHKDSRAQAARQSHGRLEAD